MLLLLAMNECGVGNMGKIMKTLWVNLHQNQYKNVQMSLDLWPPNNPCSPATNWGLSMVSGSQLQVAKLAQMCPAAPSCTQQRTTVPSGGQQCSAAASGGQRQPGSKPGSSSWVKLQGQAHSSSSRVKLPGQAPSSSSRVKTRMKHLGAPCSTKCPF